MTKASRSRLRPPLGLAACALVWWGLLTGRLVTGVVLAALLEAHHVFHSRWEISDEQASDAWTLSVILVAGSFIRSVFADGFRHAGYAGVGWLPATLAPTMLVQLYGTRTELPVGIFFAFLRRVSWRRVVDLMETPALQRTVNVEFAYLGLVAIAAGAANSTAAHDVTAPVYYLGAGAGVVWALFAAVPRAKVNGALLIAVVTAVLGAGYLGHVGLHALQLYLEQRIGLALAGDVDPERDFAVTAIGSVGRLKASSAIEWRLRVPAGHPPRYLRRATYNVYHNRSWYSVRQGALRPAERSAAVPAAWRLATSTAPLHVQNAELLGIASGESLDLALPASPLSIAGLPAESIVHNDLGVVRTRGLKGAVDFTVDFAADLPVDLPPTGDDTSVPAGERPRLTRILAGLGLKPDDPATRVRDALGQFFGRNFRYSTYLPAPGGEGDVATFLEQSRTGHCEYFATATTLLFRQAGVPARYVVGYAVEEYDQARHEFVIRGLHAHAWVQAWIDERWTVVDTTPAAWLESDSEVLPLLQPLQDWILRMQYAWDRWSNGDSGSFFTKVLGWSALPLLIAFLWFRVFRGQRQQRPTEAAVPFPSRPGMDSEWFRLESILIEQVGARRGNTTPGAWWRHVQDAAPVDLVPSVDRALQLHYRLRFDPRGLSGEEREELRRVVRECRAVLDR